MFGDCKNTKRQGDIGEAIALFEFVKAGLDVFIPFNEGQKADLVIKYDKFYSVQVKTTSYMRNGRYDVRLFSSGRKKNINKNPGDYDFLFVLLPSGDWYFIPESDISELKTSFTLNEKYEIYKNNLDYLLIKK